MWRYVDYVDSLQFSLVYFLPVYRKTVWRISQGEKYRMLNYNQFWPFFPLILGSVVTKESTHVMESWIQNPENFGSLNLESWALESGIQHKESGILLTIRIRNPKSIDRESVIQYFESGIHPVESRIQDYLGLLYMGRKER